MGRITTTLLVLITCSSLALAGDEPTMNWAEAPFDEARQQSHSEDRLLVVYATAVWCGPCRQMERTTWQSAAVVNWFSENGIAFKVDVDAMDELAEELEVQAMPTLIAFREGEMFDRTVGYKSEADLLSWLEDVRAGRRAIDRLLEEAGERVGPDGRVNIQQRLNLARQFAQGGATKEATDEYLWLWDHMLDHDSAYYGVRLSFMIHDMQRLASRSASAMDAFRERRNAYWPSIENGSATREELVDWVALAQVVDEEDALLEWVDVVKRDPDLRPMLRSSGHRLHTLLIENDRWADMVHLYDNPVEEAKKRLAMRGFSGAGMEEFDEAMREHMRASERRMDRDYLAQMYAVLLAADRDDEAKQVAGMLLESDDSTAARGALVTTALNANQPRPHQMRWIDEAEDMGARVPRARRQLAEALERE